MDWSQDFDTWSEGVSRPKTQLSIGLHVMESLIPVQSEGKIVLHEKGSILHSLCTAAKD